MVLSRLRVCSYMNCLKYESMEGIEQHCSIKAIVFGVFEARKCSKYHLTYMHGKDTKVTVLRWLSSMLHMGQIIICILQGCFIFLHLCHFNLLAKVTTQITFHCLCSGLKHAMPSMSCIMLMFLFKHTKILQSTHG